MNNFILLIDIIKPIAALLSDPNQGPFRLLIVDSIIGNDSVYVEFLFVKSLHLYVCLSSPIPCGILWSWRAIRATTETGTAPRATCSHCRRVQYCSCRCQPMVRYCIDFIDESMPLHSSSFNLFAVWPIPERCPCSDQ